MAVLSGGLRGPLGTRRDDGSSHNPSERHESLDAAHQGPRPEGTGPHPLVPVSAGGTGTGGRHFLTPVGAPAPRSPDW
ncbi:hypothetical protein GCM10022206_55220 [Streptomyces chiangmaiensis]